MGTKFGTVGRTDRSEEDNVMLEEIVTTNVVLRLRSGPWMNVERPLGNKEAKVLDLDSCKKWFSLRL